MKGGQAQTSLHKSWLRGTEKLHLTLPRQGIEPRVVGYKFQHSNNWAPIGTTSVKPTLNKINNNNAELRPLFVSNQLTFISLFEAMKIIFVDKFMYEKGL